MTTPTLTDYIKLIFTLFEQFEQYQRQVNGPKQGHPYTYSDKVLIVFFMLMQFRVVSLMYVYRHKYD